MDMVPLIDSQDLGNFQTSKQNSFLLQHLKNYISNSYAKFKVNVTLMRF